MTTSSATLSISISCKDYLNITLTSGTGKNLSVETAVTPQNLDDYLGTLYRGLDTFWKMVGTELTVGSYRSACGALIYLHKLGRQLNRELFGNRRYDVEKFIKNACPIWQQSGNADYVPPIIEITTRLDHVLPFEFLPLLDTTKPDEIDDKDETLLKTDLPILASRFLGFSAVVNRIFLQYTEGSTETVINNLPQLAVRFFRHAGLDGAQREEAFFSHVAWATVRGPWPSQPYTPTVFVSELAQTLWNGGSSSAGGLDHFQHFACHCDTNQPQSEKYCLYLSHKPDWLIDRSTRRATIGELDGEFGSFPDRPANGLYPIVFLNACGSSKLSAKGVSSFPKLFLGLKGNGGVIGTETNIPDLFAAAFSEKFYLSLIRGRTLGQAVHFARWELLKRYKNPLGLLYTVYANPDLRVRQFHPTA